MKTQTKETFDYGAYIVEFREDRDGPLSFLRKKITDLDEVLREANKLKDEGNHDVLIKLRN